MPSEPFWRSTPLAAMTQRQWESLCDRCGRCCLVKLIDSDDPEERLHYTDVACRLLDCEKGCCRDYPNRQTRVPDCMQLTVEKLPEQIPFLPPTCAYKRLYEGQDLPGWHPLLTGRAESVSEAGIAIKGRVISETQVRDDALEQHIVDWLP